LSSSSTSAPLLRILLSVGELARTGTVDHRNTVATPTTLAVLQKWPHKWQPRHFQGASCGGGRPAISTIGSQQYTGNENNC